MDWFLSITTCIVLWVMGSKNKWGPVLGVVNQGLWAVYAIRTEQEGLLLGLTIIALVYARNAWKWWREE